MKMTGQTNQQTLLYIDGVHSLFSDSKVTPLLHLTNRQTGKTTKVVNSGTKELFCPDPLRFEVVKVGDVLVGRYSMPGLLTTIMLVDIKSSTYRLTNFNLISNYTTPDFKIEDDDHNLGIVSTYKLCGAAGNKAVFAEFRNGAVHLVGLVVSSLSTNTPVYVESSIHSTSGDIVDVLVDEYDGRSVAFLTVDVGGAMFVEFTTLDGAVRSSMNKISYFGYSTNSKLAPLVSKLNRALMAFHDSTTGDLMIVDKIVYSGERVSDPSQESVTVCCNTLYNVKEPQEIAAICKSAKGYLLVRSVEGVLETTHYSRTD